MRLAKRLTLVLALVCLAAVVGAQAPKPLPFVDGSWTLVLLPDTQHYSGKYPDIFGSQTRWIVDNAAKRNIAFVMTEGDITNNNTPEQWKNAKAAMSLLDGKVPYAIVLGNHDYIGKGDLENRRSLANEYFPPELVKSSPAYGGVFEKGKLDNAYYLFTAGGRDWLALTLEFAPRDAAVKWANKVLDANPKRSAIICTHAYLYSDNTRYNHNSGVKQLSSPYSHIKTGANDGEDLWLKLISNHKNVAFVFCGHVTVLGVGRLTSQGASGNNVHQILANYQMRPKGGQGYLRLVEFLPNGKTVQVKSYSPYLDKYLTDDAQQFTLELPPAP